MNPLRFNDVWLSQGTGNNDRKRIFCSQNYEFQPYLQSVNGEKLIASFLQIKGIFPLIKNFIWYMA